MWVFHVCLSILKTDVLSQKCPRSVPEVSGAIPDQFWTMSDPFWTKITNKNKSYKKPIKIAHSYPLMGAVIYICICENHILRLPLCQG